MEIYPTLSSIGKTVRLVRILKQGKAAIFAFDHGLEHGPSDFPEDRQDPKVSIRLAIESGFDAIMTTKGIAKATWNVWSGKIPLILKVTGKSKLRPQDAQLLQSPIGFVQEALAIGADALAATVYWGSPQEDLMVERFTNLASACERYGLPILMLAYPRGPTIPDRTKVEIVKYASRAGAEIGADLIKTHYTGSTESFREVVSATPVPVMMSGGPKADDERDFLKIVRSVMDAGGAGVVVGRNVFQSKNFVKMAKAIMLIVHEDASLEEASSYIRKPNPS